ncbi:SPRY domain-containing SOCS box protein 2 [Centroberyx gerrardi]
MGLKLSVWLYSMTADSPPSCSSAFPPLAVPPPSRLAVTLNSSPVAPGDSRSHWSSAHCSPHFLLSACREEVTRTPVEQSSDGVRAEMGVKSGLHVWELLWSPAHRGSHAVMGVSCQNCPLQASGYEALVGGDCQSWGWELKTNQLWHGGQSLGMYPGERKRCHSEGAEAPLPVPERVLLVLDADAGTLGYVVDGCFLGVAFKDLPRGVELFPAVSSVRGGATIRLRYLNGATRDPPALMALCGLSIRRSLGQQRQNQTDKLPLPPFLQRYLLPSL